jgi:hypothetical protein
VTDELRKTDEQRTVTFTVKLSEQEALDLKNLAAMNFRRPGDELRFLLNKAVGRKGGTS